MKKKIMMAGALACAACVLAFPFCWVLSVVLLVGLVLAAAAGALFLILNKLYIRTNHWKNQFAFEKNFISGAGYRDNLNRNFDIVNLGSNPAKYGFFYEQVRGQNWATGSQGLEMDFEILKTYHSYLKKDGVVLIPIMPFTAVSQYIKNRPDYWSDVYYMKFAKILDYSQARQLPGGKKLQRMLRYPLIYHPKWVRYVFIDESRDDGLLINEQTMDALELAQDADQWIRGWMREFNVSSMKDFLVKDFEAYREEAKTILKEMVRFCEVRDMKPVFITVPMSGYLAAKFSPEFRKRMIVDFVAEANEKNVPFLDYMFDERFSDAAFYNGSFFLNLKGRKAFSMQVIRDLGLQ